MYVACAYHNFSLSVLVVLSIVTLSKALNSCFLSTTTTLILPVRLTISRYRDNYVDIKR